MAGQIDGQHVPAVIVEVAALQCPHAVVVKYTVDEHHGGLCGDEWFAGSVGVQALAVNVGMHVQAPAFAAALSARLRSSIRSSGSSRPIDRRMVPGPMPAWVSAASLRRKWVVLAGWMTRLRQSPTLARWLNSCRWSINALPCSRLPSMLKLNTLPAPLAP